MHARHSLEGTWAPIIAAALLSLAVCCFGVTPTYGQAASATLLGAVTDETGARIPGAKVVLSNPATGFERNVTSDSTGRFNLQFLPPGKYVLQADKEGFATGTVQDVVLNVNDQLSLGISLKVAGEKSSVTVVAEASRASVAAGVGTVVDRQFIANVPLNGRSLQALLQLVPGVVLVANSGATTSSASAQFSVNGQRATANYFMVDGVSANTGIQTEGSPGPAGSGQAMSSTVLGGTSSMASLDAIQEFRMETSTYAPEFGRTPGGQISLITRSGTNELHGSASEYFRHDAMNANDWFANRSSLAKPKMRQNQFGGVLGGPLLADRLFFFASYEGLRLEQPTVRNIRVPTLAIREQAPAALKPYLNAIPLPNGRDFGNGVAEFVASYSNPARFDASSLRLDVQPTNNLTALFRFNHVPSLNKARTRSLSNVANSRADSDSFTAGATWLAAQNLSIDGRLNATQNHGTQRLTLHAFGGATPPVASDIFTSGADLSRAGFTFFPLLGSGGTTWTIGPTSLAEQRQVNAVMTVAWSVRSHQVKSGVDYRRLSPMLGTGATTETLIFVTPQDLADSRPLLYRIDAEDPTQREAIITSWSAYAQDTWQVSSRLTLTYGVRFERVPPVSEATGRMPRTVLGIDGATVVNPRLAPPGTPLWRDRTGSLAPRIGVAYQAGRRPGAESTVRGGVGIFYDTGLGLVANGFAAAYPFIGGRSVPSPQFPLSDALRVVPTLGVDPPFSMNLLDPNIRLPYTRQWHLTWEQALGARQNVSIGYVGAAGRRLLLAQTYSQALADWPNSPMQLVVQRNRGESAYKALQAQYQRRLRRGLQILTSYTLASASDNGSSDTATAFPDDQAALSQAESAPSGFDVRHTLSSGITYDVPTPPGGRAIKDMFGGWGLDVMFRSQSALPVNPRVNGNLSFPGFVGFAQRPDRVLGVPLYLDDSSVPGGQRFNPDAFATPPDQTRQGTFSRNGLRGLAASQVDIAVRRQFGLWGGVKLQLRAELFNLLNHPNFGPPADTVSDPLFGQPDQMLNQSLGGLNALYQMGGPRSGQLALKVLF